MGGTSPRRSLQCCKLRHLPEELGACASLVWLALNANALQDLPDAMGRLTNLQRLSLHINELRALPPGIGELAKLEALCVRQWWLAAARPA